MTKPIVMAVTNRTSSASTDGGIRRLLGLAEGLSSDFHVVLVGPFSAASESGLEEFSLGPGGRPHPLRHLVPTALNSAHLWTGRRRDKFVEIITKMAPIAVIYGHHNFAMDVPTGLVRLKVADFQDNDIDRLRQLSQLPSPAGFPRLESVRARLWQPRILRQMDLATCLTSDDCQYVSQHTDAVLIENGASPRNQSLRPDGNITFVANFEYPPNREAAEWFVSTVLPLIDNELIPLLRFAGKGSEQFSGLIHRTGLFRSADDVYAESRLIFNPVTTGAGSQLKLVESGEFSVPSVVRNYSRRTAPDWLRDLLVVAESAADFAMMINQLARSPERLAKISDSLARAARHSTWRSQCAPLVAHFNAALTATHR